MYTPRYKNILLFGSPQFAGNINEYFIKHSEKLVLYITMPRFGNKFNYVKLYKKGRLISEKKVISSGNIFLYYFFWYVTYWQVLLQYYHRTEHFYVISWQPHFFIGGTFQKILRRLDQVYWVGDYFPPINLQMKMYEKIKKHYHDRMEYVCYLSDRINRKMNNKIVKKPNKKTIMWGICPMKTQRKSNKLFTIVFIGVIKQSQGLELLFKSMRNVPSIHLKILGSSDKQTYMHFKNLITKMGLSNRIYYPNKMFYDKELQKEVASCHIGVALYEVSKNNATYYADPGKVKTYAQYGLPIIMTPIADVKKYITKFNAGEVIKPDEESIVKSLKKIRTNYKKYTSGLKKFNEYFYYESYYKKRFVFLEK